MKKFKPGQSVVVLLFGNKYLGTISTQDLYNNYSDMVLVDIELSEDECETINVYIYSRFTMLANGVMA